MVPPAAATDETAQPRAKAPRRGLEATASVRARAEALGLLGRLDAPDVAAPADAAAGGEYTAALERRLLERAAEAWDTPRTATALTWAEDFVRATRRDLFIPANGSQTDIGRRWNRRTLDLLEAHIVSSPPLGRTKGEHTSIDVARSYSGAIYTLRCREAEYDVAPANLSYIAPLAAKTTRRQQPLPSGSRELGVGIRAVHISAAAAAGFDRQSRRGKQRWGALVGSHNLLLRGGEIGIPDNARPEPRRVLSGSRFAWQLATRETRGRPWLIVWVVPIKDPHGKLPAHPCPVARRHDGPFGADPLCPYDALAAVWWQRMFDDEPFPTDMHGCPLPGWWQREAAPDRLAAPLFCGNSGAAWTTADSRALYCDVATAAGLDPTGVGGKAARIGGATDSRDVLGPSSLLTIQRRGRWCSIVGRIYERETVSAQLDLSCRVGDAVSQSLEEACTGWVQPTGM